MASSFRVILRCAPRGMLLDLRHCWVHWWPGRRRAVLLKRLQTSKTAGVFLKSLNLATLNSACLFSPLNLKTTICCSDRGLYFTSTPVNKGTDWQGVAACAFTPCQGAVGYKLLILLFFVEHVARRQCKFAFTTVQHSARHCADIWFERIR